MPPPMPDCVDDDSYITVRRVISPTFPFSSKIVLAVLGPSPYTINFRISSFISTRRPTEILVEIVLNLMSV